MEYALKNALHFGPVEPALPGAVANDGQVVCRDESGPCAIRLRTFLEEEEAPEAKTPGLSDLGELLPRQGDGSHAETGSLPVEGR